MVTVENRSEIYVASLQNGIDLFSQLRIHLIAVESNNNWRKKLNFELYGPVVTLRCDWDVSIRKFPHSAAVILFIKYFWNRTLCYVITVMRKHVNFLMKETNFEINNEMNNSEYRASVLLTSWNELFIFKLRIRNNQLIFLKKKCVCEKDET